jgi:hypothetical protein
MTIGWASIDSGGSRLMSCQGRRNCHTTDNRSDGRL